VKVIQNLLREERGQESELYYLMRVSALENTKGGFLPLIIGFSAIGFGLKRLHA
jgi:hypothetical protein